MPSVTFAGISGHVAGILPVTFTGTSVTIPESPVTLVRNTQACYAELPGVAICQLQRREGIDAVHVSRWTWDGRARQRDDDPDRRFQPLGDAAPQPGGVATVSDGG